MVRKQVPSLGIFLNSLTSLGAPGGRFLELAQPLASGTFLSFLPGPAVGSHPGSETACWRPRPLPASTSGLKSESKNQRKMTVCRSWSSFKSEPTLPGGILKNVLFSPSDLPGVPHRGIGAPRGLAKAVQRSRLLSLSAGKEAQLEKPAAQALGRKVPWQGAMRACVHTYACVNEEGQEREEEYLVV